ncbi:sigma-70 family RNA polymerase sigma factor [Kribbella sp. NBC_00709]|uniref:sigma-70 family RNA polymerase sigma factor n=1 Tax=Kribbella sp. NBC_00709 TaxID=2975972 RepID=UPI002E29F984|nr:sigma-70 family RNA polymerase sigma factor [Kribbella sp. NBC_00709]
MTEPIPLRWPSGLSASSQGLSDGDLLAMTAGGDTAAFSALYDRISPSVFGLVRRILRNPAQSEEVTQEVMIDIWRTANRYDPARGSAQSWILTIAHRRAVDRVRSEQASADRLERVGARSAEVDFDQVADTVTTRLETEQVRRCLDRLTDLQRESINLAYYNGYTYPEVAQRLGAKLPTIKARMRDGLIRLRDCLGTAEGATQ